MTTPLQSAARAVLPLLYKYRPRPSEDLYNCRSCGSRAVLDFRTTGFRMFATHAPDCPVARLERAVREEERR